MQIRENILVIQQIKVENQMLIFFYTLLIQVADSLGKLRYYLLIFKNGLQKTGAG